MTGVAGLRWIAESDLPDDELQAVYVREAEKHWRKANRERLALEGELAAAREAEGRAAAFLAEAQERLRYYQARARGAVAARASVTEATEATFKPARRALPRPKRR